MNGRHICNTLQAIHLAYVPALCINKWVWHFFAVVVAQIWTLYACLRTPNMSERIPSLSDSSVCNLTFLADEYDVFQVYWQCLVSMCTCLTHPSGFWASLGDLCVVLHLWQVSSNVLICLQVYSSCLHCYARVCMSSMCLHGPEPHVPAHVFVFSRHTLGIVNFGGPPGIPIQTGTVTSAPIH